MSYATLADIEARYPGELAQAGPTVDAALDEDAVAAALAAADETIDMALRALGRAVPMAAPIPAWAKNIAVDLALYLATPTALASQEDFKDRRRRYDDALSALAEIVAGKRLPPPAADAATADVFVASRRRLFGRGAL